MSHTSLCSRYWLMLAACVMMAFATLQAHAQTAPLLPAPGEEERWQFDSPRWEKAVTFEGFTLSEEREESRELLEPTTVKVFHDGTNLHVLYIASDTQPAKIKADAFEEFADRVPQGDHGQLTVGSRHIFAFGPQGNKYDAYLFDREFFSGFQVRSRVTDKSWQSIVIIPLKALPRDRDGSLRLTFVRHLDRGMDQPQRSYLAVNKVLLATE